MEWEEREGGREEKGGDIASERASERTRKRDERAIASERARKRDERARASERARKRDERERADTEVKEMGRGKREESGERKEEMRARESKGASEIAFPRPRRGSRLPFLCAPRRPPPWRPDRLVYPLVRVYAGEAADRHPGAPPQGGSPLAARRQLLEGPSGRSRYARVVRRSKGNSDETRTSDSDERLGRATRARDSDERLGRDTRTRDSTRPGSAGGQFVGRLVGGKRRLGRETRMSDSELGDTPISVRGGKGPCSAVTPSVAHPSLSSESRAAPRADMNGRGLVARDSDEMPSPALPRCHQSTAYERLG